jgi:protein-S-isoprenylcysteine O-methyltransferase Ste14
MNRKALLGKALLEVLGEFAVFAALLFVCAGTLSLARRMGVHGTLLWLRPYHRAVAGPQRARTPSRADVLPMQRGQPLWNKVFVVAVMVLFVAWLILMPLDAVRFGWSEVPGWLQIFGALGVVLSFYIMFLTFRENAYLALVVKVQQERGQSVVSTGPYRYVRYSMCASTLLFFPGAHCF